MLGPEYFFRLTTFFFLIIYFSALNKSYIYFYVNYISDKKRKNINTVLKEFFVCMFLGYRKQASVCSLEFLIFNVLNVTFSEFSI